MKLYRIWQREEVGYDVYDSAVVCAESEDDAREIHPSEFFTMDDTYTGGWTTRDKVQVEYLGEAAPHMARGVVCASFNAG